MINIATYFNYVYMHMHACMSYSKIYEFCTVIIIIIIIYVALYNYTSSTYTYGTYSKYEGPRWSHRKLAWAAVMPAKSIKQIVHHVMHGD